ncbi:MAG: glycosyl transferase family 1, partial [Gemmatimonadaceae bacterium]|nr:glycosyl transferase family 1 [Acetobacteraceae bacterium]
MRIGIITAVEPLGGGLHRILADGIATALVAMGHQVECALLPFSTTTDVLEQAWAFRTLSLCEAFDRVVTL